MVWFMGLSPQHGFMAAMDKGLLEAASDASFAPEGQRSQSGVNGLRAP